jgi:hypothetical protein
MYKYLVLPVFTLFFLNHRAILDNPMLTVLKSSIGSFPDFNAMVSFADTKMGLRVLQVGKSFTIQNGNGRWLLKIRSSL